MCMRLHNKQRENDSTLMYNMPFDLLVCFSGLRSRRTGIFHIWSRGRHFSLFVPVLEARCLEAMHAQAESDRWVEISGSVVKVQCSDNTSRSTVTRYTINSGYAHAYVHLLHAMRGYKIEE